MSVAYTQTRQIKGQILDEGGQPLPLASILVSGTNNGTQSDKDGSFTISVPGAGDVTLVISFTGYKKQNVKTNGNAPLKITMQKEASNLEDVVVVGYSSVRRRLL